MILTIIFGDYSENDFKVPIGTLVSKWSQGLRISLGFILLINKYIIIYLDRVSIKK
jgi:hypothetical protein